MKRRTVKIGRSPHVDIVVADDGVAAQHGELVLTGEGDLYLTDCASGSETSIRRGGAWQDHRQGFVEETDELRFGNFHCTGAELRRRVLATVEDPEGPAGRGGGVAPVLPRGSVERDPATGEIVRRKI